MRTGGQHADRRAARGQEGSMRTEGQHADRRAACEQEGQRWSLAHASWYCTRLLTINISTGLAHVCWLCTHLLALVSSAAVDPLPWWGALRKYSGSIWGRAHHEECGKGWHSRLHARGASGPARQEDPGR